MSSSPRVRSPRGKGGSPAAAVEPEDTAVEQVFIDRLRSAITKLARTQRAERQRDMRALPFSLSSALSTLERLGPLTATELAHLEGVSKPSLTRALAALEERGLIRREVVPADTRQFQIHVTPTGLESIAESRRIVDEWYARRLSQLTPRDVRTLKGAVDALHRLANETI